jgi:hypothetical protein
MLLRVFPDTGVLLGAKSPPQQRHRISTALPIGQFGAEAATQAGLPGEKTVSCEPKG